MRRFAVIISALLMFAAEAGAQEASLEDTIAAVNDSVVSVVAENTEGQALGAGIVISADGYIVTNAHVAENAAKISVITTADEEYEAVSVGSDEQTDIALLKVNGAPAFKAAEFADSDKVRVGNKVFAIGNPFGLGNSVSAGIISAKERDIEKGPYDNFLQTDTAINQGNSGGPLFNAEGKVVGMNTAIFSTDGNSMGVGFSTPSNAVRWVADELKTNGKVVRGRLGIGVRKIRLENEDQKTMLAVTLMEEDSPAAAAGLKVGDILLKAGDLELTNPRIFSWQVSKTKPGTVLPLTVLRDGKTEEFEVIVGAVAEKKEIGEDTGNTVAPADRSGIRIEPLGMRISYDENSGIAAVEEVDENSEAAAKGIKPGDRFVTVNGRKIFGLEDLSVKAKEAEDEGKAVLQFVSDEGVDTVTLNLKDGK